MWLQKRREKLILVSHGYENIYERGFCNGLSDSGFSFLLVSSNRTDYRGLRKNTRTINLRGSQNENRSRLTKIVNLALYHAKLLLYIVSSQPQVVHVIGLLAPAVLCGIVEGLIFRLTCKRYVLTVHNLLPHDHHTPWNFLVYRISFRLANVLVVHTERMRNDLSSRYGVKPQFIMVMQHGLERQERRAEITCEKLKFSPFNILFFGKILRYKGIDLLLSALVDFPHPYELTIAGAVVDARLKDELQKQISVHPGRDCINWGGHFVPESEIEGLFMRASVVALPYRHIDQSGILFQALRFGVPVVATRVGSFQDYISDELGELCRPDDIADLRAALIRIHERSSLFLREKILSYGKKYEWAHCVQCLCEVYEVER